MSNSMNELVAGTITIELAREKVAQELQEWWEACQDGHVWMSPKALAVVQAFESLGIITKDESEMWNLRILHKCPEADGHGGGRAWCAYCGNIPEPKPE